MRRLLATVPDPFDTLEEYRRARHEDVALMDNEQLSAERIWTSIRWSSLRQHRRHDEACWWRTRLDVITRECQRRQRRTRR
jgi:hypothetical protein